MRSICGVYSVSVFTLSCRERATQENGKVMAKEIIQFFVAANLVPFVLGHGMMLDPPSRNSAWRYFSNRPKQYTDNELNCGGFSAQWDKHGGKCGVCGDEYNIANPKYVYPGLFAQDGFITKTYKKGETIQITIKITSNHQGFFRFTVGKLERRPITQEQLTHVLLQPDGSNTWQLHSSANGNYHIKLVLPKSLTCDHCVLQWWWTVGNNWGCNEEGNCGVGLGKKQETFVNCADIKITPEGGASGTDAPLTEQPSTQAPLTGSTPSSKPPKTQKPSTGCKATGPWTGQAAMDKWCVQNCALGNCPSSHCQC